MSGYRSLQNELSSHRIDLHASELHGMLTGYLCAVKDASTTAQRRALFGQWCDGNLPESIATFLETAFSHSLDNLGEYADFEFNLLLPTDEAPIDERARSIAIWCSGFLSGFGESGRQIDKSDESDVSEALEDLAKVAGMTDEVPEGDENEADLIEIIEFIRISTLLIFAENSKTGTH
jgi:uncharacterized protein YgfB (UPF0149 family)